MTIEDVKRCNGCGKIKKLTEFHPDKSKSSGIRSQCKKCINSKDRERDNKKREKKKVEALKKKPKKKIVKIPANKQLCNRNGKIMLKTLCVPGCNDACNYCKNPQVRNIKAGGDNLTPEEDREAMLIGTHRSSGAIAVEEGYSEI